MPLNFFPASSFHAEAGGCEIRAYNDGNVLPFSVMLKVASLFLECECRGLQGAVVYKDRF